MLGKHYPEGDGNYYARYDVFNGKDRLHVAVRLDNDTDVEKYRPMALKALKNAMENKGWNFNDLRPLPIPAHCSGRYVNICQN